MIKLTAGLTLVLLTALAITRSAQGDEQPVAEPKPVQTAAKDEPQDSDESAGESEAEAEAEAEAEVAAVVEQPAEMDAPEEKLFCRTVKRVGSHRRVRVCKTTDEIERSSREAEDFIDAAFPGNVPGNAGLGGDGN